MNYIPTNRFNFEFEIDKDSEDMIEGTWHITESDLVHEQDIVKTALESQFSDADMIDRYEVQLYRENGMELTGDCTSGVFVAYRGGIPV